MTSQHVCTAPSRRKFFTASAATAAFLAIGGAAPPPNPDAVFIQACADHARNFVAVNASGVDYAVDHPAWQAYDVTSEAISNGRPQTLAGVVAKAQATKVEAATPSGDECWEDGLAAVWIVDVVRDLLRVANEGEAV